MDSSGIYILGYTNSNDFPMINSYNSTFGGSNDVLLVKYDVTGNNILYSTYIGGNNNDFGIALTLDNESNVYITGYSNSPNFPVMNALNSTFGGIYDIFVSKLASNGSTMLFSTFIGGNSSDISNDIVLDQNNNIYIVGSTNSPDFPVFNAYNTTFGSGTDAVVIKLTSDGQTLVYSTFIGGSGNDNGWGIDVDTNGNAYLTGITMSTNFPTINYFDNSYNGGNDIFVLKLSSDGHTLIYSTYIGGSGNDYAARLRIVGSGDVLIAGDSVSSNFPITPGFNATISGGSDITLTKLAANGSTLLFSRFIGGSLDDLGYGLDVDLNDNAYIIGYSLSPNFPMVNPANATFSGNKDTVAMKISSDGKIIYYSTFVGGSGNDFGYDIVLDPNQTVYVTGTSDSTNFPVINGFITTNSSTNLIIYKLEFLNQTSLLKDYTPNNIHIQLYQNNTQIIFGISWEKPNFAYLLIHFNVYKGVISGNYTMIGNSTDTTFNDTVIMPNVTYYYVVTALYSFGEAPNSPEIHNKFMGVYVTTTETEFATSTITTTIPTTETNITTNTIFVENQINMLTLATGIISITGLALILLSRIRKK